MACSDVLVRAQDCALEKCFSEISAATIFPFSTLFALLPTTVFILVSPIYVWHSRKEHVTVLPSYLLYWKCAANVALICLECTNLALWSSTDQGNKISIAAKALDAISAVLVFTIVYTKHCYALRSSSFVAVYLLYSTVSDAAKIPGLLSASGFTTMIFSFIMSIVVKVFIAVLEEIPKHKCISNSSLRKAYSQDAVSGFWTRQLFTWLARTIRLGFKSVITIDDLTDLGSSFISADVSAKFGAILLEMADECRLYLFRAALKAFPKQVFLVIITRLAYPIFTYLQPSLIKRAISLLGDSDDSLASYARCSLVGYTVLVFAGIALFRAMYSYHNYRLIMLLRSCLIGQIFEKMQSLRYSEVDQSSIMALMTADMDILVNGLVKIHDVWAAPFEVATGLFCLYNLAGFIAFSALLWTLGVASLAVLVGSKVGPLQSTWSQRISERTAKTSVILAQMKSLKMMGLEYAASSCIDELRKIEVDSFRIYRVLLTIITVASVLNFSLIPVIGLTGLSRWVEEKVAFTPATAFGALSIIVLTVSPINAVLNAALVVPPMAASFARMQKFFLLQRPRDRRRFGEGRKRRRQGEQSHGLSKGVQTPLIKLTKRWPTILALRLSICLPGSSEYLIHMASFAIAENSLTVLLGPTGSGKTTLLRALIGEVPYYGSLGLDHSSIAYCGQTPWIQNASLRQNITGPMRFDSAWYDSVLDACLLSEDIELLQHGDATIVGTDGVAISGGQRQRVGLARAVYSRARTIILDGVFSSLDERTTGDIMQKLLGPFGLLKNANCTVILSTTLAKYVDFADKLLVLDGIGGLSSKSLTKRRCESNQLTDRVSTTPPMTRQEVSMISAFHEGLPTAGLEVTLQGDVRDRGNMDLYWFYVTATCQRQIIVYVILVMAVVLVERLPRTAMNSWLQGDLYKSQTHFSFASMGIFSTVCAVAMMLLYLVGVIPRAETAIHNQLLRTVMRTPLSFLSGTDLSFFLNRFSQDMTSLTQTLPLALHQFTYLTTALVVEAAVIATATKYTALLIPVLVTVTYFTQTFYLRTSRQLRYLDMEAKKSLYTLMAEATKGLEHIRSFMWKPQMLQRMFRALDRSQKATYYVYTIQRWLELVLDLITGVLAVMLMILATHAKHTSPSALGFSLVALVSFGQGMGHLTQSWNALEASVASISRLRSFINTTPQEPTIWGGVDLRIANLPKYGNIAFRNVSAKYSPSDGKDVLSSISAEIEDGCKVGLIGRTGSGKSSVFAALLNLIEYRGLITIDGIDISTIPQHVLRSQLITTITQDPIKLPGSIRDNLLPYEGQKSDGSLKEFDIYGALRRVGLKDVVSSKGGLDFPIDDAELTPGQMQMLSIARAILHHAYVDSRIVLIDEATGNMDTELEDKLQPVLRESFRECTVLIITHRPETLEEGERIIEMDTGRIISVL